MSIYEPLQVACGLKLANQHRGEAKNPVVKADDLDQITKISTKKSPSLCALVEHVSYLCTLSLKACLVPLKTSKSLVRAE
jgi:hypothetical protein